MLLNFYLKEKKKINICIYYPKNISNFILVFKVNINFYFPAVKIQNFQKERSFDWF